MSGVTHWWRQRLSSVALVPLSLWLLWAGASVSGAGYESAVAFMGHPLNAALAVLTVLVTAYHAQSGIQVIVEDYVPGKLFPATLIWATRAAVTLGSLAVAWSAWSLAT